MSSRVLRQIDWSVRRLQPPIAEPMTLAEAKLHLRIPDDVDEFDTLVSAYIRSARAYLEGTYGVYLSKQTVELLLQNFPREDTIRMPIWPVQSVDYFNFTDVAGVTRSLTVGTQILTRLYKKAPELVLPFAAVWPQQILTTADPIAIGLTVGYKTGSSPETLPMPENALEAMRFLLGHQYNNGSAVTLGSLQKSDPIAIGVDNFMGDVRLWA